MIKIIECIIHNTASLIFLVQTIEVNTSDVKLKELCKAQIDALSSSGKIWYNLKKSSGGNNNAKT